MDFDECDFLFDVMYLKGEMFLNENFPFSLRLFVHVYMFNLLHNMRKNRTIVHVPWERESLHIENSLRYFSAWNTLKLHRGGTSRREWERKKNTKFSIFTIHLHATKLSDVFLLPSFERLDLKCLDFLPGISGSAPATVCLKMYV